MVIILAFYYYYYYYYGDHHHHHHHQKAFRKKSVFCPQAAVLSCMPPPPPLSPPRLAMLPLADSACTAARRPLRCRARGRRREQLPGGDGCHPAGWCEGQSAAPIIIIIVVVNVIGVQERIPHLLQPEDQVHTKD